MLPTISFWNTYQRGRDSSVSNSLSLYKVECSLLRRRILFPIIHIYLLAVSEPLSLVESVDELEVGEAW